MHPLFSIDLRITVIAILLGAIVYPLEAGLISSGVREPTSPEYLSLKAAAENGSAEAAWRLGTLLATGNAADGVDPNAIESERWLRLALSKGEIQARTPLGRLLLETSSQGQHVDRAVEGLGLLRTAAESNPGANVLLGFLNAEGRFMKPDFGKAEAHFQVAAKMGLSAGWHRLGWLYSGEAGFPEKADANRAVEYLEKGFAGGEIEAGRLLVKLLREGIRIPKDDEKAFRLVREAADRGDSGALFFLGQLYEEGVGVAANPEEAKDAFLLAAEAGNAEAENMMGVILFAEGEGSPADREASLTWFEKSAAQGFAEAHLNAAILLNESGIGESALVGKEAKQHLIIAASAGIPEAQDLLGAWYRDGVHGPTDQSAAAEWFRQAALKGNILSMIRLGLLIEQDMGRLGTAEDLAALYQEAAAGGHPYGHFLYARLLLSGELGVVDLAHGFAHLSTAANAGFGLAKDELAGVRELLSDSQFVQAEAIMAKLTVMPWKDEN